MSTLTLNGKKADPKVKAKPIKQDYTPRDAMNGDFLDALKDRYGSTQVALEVGSLFTSSVADLEHWTNAQRDADEVEAATHARFMVAWLAAKAMSSLMEHGEIKIKALTTADLPTLNDYAEDYAERARIAFDVLAAVKIPAKVNKWLHRPWLKAYGELMVLASPAAQCDAQIKKLEGMPWDD